MCIFPESLVIFKQNNFFHILILDWIMFHHRFQHITRLLSQFFHYLFFFIINVCMLLIVTGPLNFYPFWRTFLFMFESKKFQLKSCWTWKILTNFFFQNEQEVHQIIRIIRKDVREISFKIGANIFFSWKFINRTWFRNTN